jgi:hypothetical protein
MIKDKGRWRIFKLKLIDARLYFVSIFVGLLTGLVAVPYHYLLQFFFNLRHDFFDSRPKWYWYIPLFLLMWGILVFVSWLVKKMPLITGGGIPQTRGVINGRVDYKHPFLELVAKFVGGILALSTGLSLGREGATALSITGQCNAMGTRETGFTSSLPGYRNFASSYDREEYASLVNVPVDDVPTKRGYSYPQIIDAIETGEIKALWVMATNPIVSFPDQNKLRKALNKLELLVVQDAFKSETALIADVVFSAATWKILSRKFN